ncbi:Crp/Fnr family transcriptional regulator [Zhouia amylolytica]|uniref:Crp/Fnr family transcriptional regulator n=1 Tax=Zhouia amylolytica TaxID=376730 RepID=UPI0020CD76E6|nr:Crp/Fnr family transcriptional regulator [Zhouia amylolytica]
MWKSDVFAVNVQSSPLTKAVNWNLVEDIDDILHFKKGQYIYFQGSSPQGIFIIKNGTVKISRNACNGKEFVVKIASDGHMFGHISLLNHSRYNNSAVALEDTTVLFIHKTNFLETIKKQEGLFEHFIQQLCSHIIKIEQKATNMAYKPVRGRLAQLLLSLDNQLNNDSSDEEIPHSLFMTRADMAGLIGTVKETVNRILSEFRQEGIIDTNGTKIYILNAQKLLEISHLYD